MISLIVVFFKNWSLNLTWGVGSPSTSQTMETGACGMTVMSASEDVSSLMEAGTSTFRSNVFLASPALFFAMHDHLQVYSSLTVWCESPIIQWNRKVLFHFSGSQFSSMIHAVMEMTLNICICDVYNLSFWDCRTKFLFIFINWSDFPNIICSPQFTFQHPSVEPIANTISCPRTESAIFPISYISLPAFLLYDSIKFISVSFPISSGFLCTLSAAMQCILSRSHFLQNHINFRELLYAKIENGWRERNRNWGKTTDTTKGCNAWNPTKETDELQVWEVIGIWQSWTWVADLDIAVASQIRQLNRLAQVLPLDLHWRWFRIVHLEYSIVFSLQSIGFLLKSKIMSVWQMCAIKCDLHDFVNEKLITYSQNNVSITMMRFYIYVAQR